MGKPRDSLTLQLRKMVGTALREWRERSGVTVTDVAKCLNVIKDQVYKIERGERDITSADLAKLSIIFSVPVERLVFGDRPKPVVIPKISFKDVGD
jgi:transcriptional regulator with XRE-family HTH domain